MLKIDSQLIITQREDQFLMNTLVPCRRPNKLSIYAWWWSLIQRHNLYFQVKHQNIWNLRLATSLAWLPPLRKDQLGDTKHSLNLLLSESTIRMTFRYPRRNTYAQVEQVTLKFPREMKTAAQINSYNSSYVKPMKPYLIPLERLWNPLHLSYRILS